MILQDVFLRKIFLSFYSSTKKNVDRHGVSGFTLVEVLVVMVITAILTLGVVQLLTSYSAKAKAAAFSLRGDINLARSEAVTRNKNVLIQFFFNVSDASFVNGSGDLDGYRICVDGDTGTPDDSCGDADDTKIRDTRMEQVVQFYDTTGGQPAGGPGLTPTDAGAANLVGTAANQDGVVFTDNTFRMMTDGTSDETGSGTAVIYIPKTGNPTEMLVEPFAVNVNPTGRVWLERWRTNTWSDN